MVYVVGWDGGTPEWRRLGPKTFEVTMIPHGLSIPKPSSVEGPMLCSPPRILLRTSPHDMTFWRVRP